MYHTSVWSTQEENFDASLWPVFRGKTPKHSNEMMRTISSQLTRRIHMCFEPLQLKGENYELQNTVRNHDVRGFRRRDGKLQIRLQRIRLPDRRTQAEDRCSCFAQWQSC